MVSTLLGSWSSMKIKIIVQYWYFSYVWKNKQIMSKFFINLFIRFGKSESLRKGVLFILKDLSAKSDNDVDDAIVKMIEEKLFPVKWKI